MIQSVLIMTKLPFKVSARTARLIGRENVSNADGALIELIKNAYDADATQVSVIFDGDDLFIIDNGHGMTEEIIRNSWMTIGTNNKELEPYSPDHRIKAGAKGIGRFALDRLGKTVEMFTLPKGQTTGFLWTVDWSDFEKSSATVNDVNANLEEIVKLNIDQKLPHKILDDRKIKLKFPDGGTILKISALRDPWTKEALYGLFRGMESLVPVLEDDSFSIILLSSRYNDEFGAVKPLINDDYDYKMQAKYDSEIGKVSIKIERNEFDLSQIEKKFAGVFDNPLMKDFPYDLTTFKKGEFTQIYTTQEIMKGSEDLSTPLKMIGDFIFTLSFAKNTSPEKDSGKYPYKNANYKLRSDWLKKFGGIKIYRDNFRVRPYGESGEDWLKLGERAAQSPAGPGQGLGGYKIRPNQVVGSIAISRIHNKGLEDKSSREGIVENEVFNAFKELILKIISVLEKDRNTIFVSFSKLYEQTSENERIKREAQEAAARIAEKIKKDNGTPPFFEDPDLKDDAAKVTKAFKVLEDEIVEKNEENKILRSLASAGLITAAVTHELRGLENVLLTRNDELRGLIKPYIKDDQLKEVNAAYNPFVLLDEMKKTDTDLHEWISYALTPLKKDKRDKKIIVLRNYFEDLYSMWKYILNERKISFACDNFDEKFAITAYLIDLDTIFNNLIINSIESFSKKKDSHERSIKISCVKDKEYYKITYSDNGIGLHSTYSKNPNDIFAAQETTKKDGTGMGMYLVKSVVDENKGKINLLSPKEGFSLSISMPIKE